MFSGLFYGKAIEFVGKGVLFLAGLVVSVLGVRECVWGGGMPFFLAPLGENVMSPMSETLKEGLGNTVSMP